MDSFSESTAEQAWSRKYALEESEWSQRCLLATRHAHPDMMTDHVTARWLAWCKRDFAASWKHAAAIGVDIRETYAAMLTSPASPHVLKKVMGALSLDVRALLSTFLSHEGPSPFAETIASIEGVLVACMGHYAAGPRAHSIRLLNVLYDGVDWQLAGAHDTAIRFVKDPCIVDIFTPAASVPDPASIRVLFCGPPCEPSASSRVDHVLTMHTPTVSVLQDAWLPAASQDSGSEVPRFERASVLRVTLELAPFARCGFYDWRVVMVTGDGAATAVPLVTRVTPQEMSSLAALGCLPAPSQAAATSVTDSADAAATPVVFAPVEAPSPAQGRFIVQRSGALDELVHEVIVDLEGMRFTDAGEIVKHGSFHDVAKQAAGLKAKGVSSLYVMGAIERDNGWAEVDTDSEDPAVRAALDLAVKHGLVLPPSSARLPGADPGAEQKKLQKLISGQYASMPARPASVTESAPDMSDFGFFDGSESEVHTPLTQQKPLQSQQPLHPLSALVLRTGAAGVTFTSALAVPPAPAPMPPPQPPPIPSFENDADDEASSAALGAGFRAFATRPDANPHAVVDRITPNRMLGGPLGLFHLVKASRSLGMRVLVQLDASVSASRPHRKYAPLYARTLDAKGQSAIHHGTDALENQWEDQQLLNYRKVETWNLLVSEAKTLVLNFGIGGLYLTDAQSYPFIMAMDPGELFRRDPDGEGHYSAKQVLEGEVVIANSEIGFWSTRLSRTYANPLLVKLCRALWQVDPFFSVVGECHWARSGALMRSGIIPHTLDLVGALAATINRFVDKNGRISSFSAPQGAQPVHYLRGLLLGEQTGIIPVQGAPQFVSQKLSHGEYPPPLQHLLQGPGGALPSGGHALLLRSLSSSRLPYPALLLGRNAWTAVDLLYTLPGVPMTFGEERLGKAYRVDVTGTYAHNTAYLDNERKKREQRVAAEKRAQRVRTTLPQQQLSARSHNSAEDSKPHASSGHSRPSDAQVVGEMFAYMGITPSQGQSAGVAAGVASVQARIAPPSTGDMTPDVYEGHVGVGGVVPAVAPRGAPAWKLSRGGFSVAEGMDSLASATSTPTSAQPRQVADDSLAHARAAPHLAPAPVSAAALRPHGVFGLPRPGERNYDRGSSPALQALLLEAQADVVGSGVSTRQEDVSSHAQPSAESARGLGEEDEEDDTEEGQDISTPLSSGAKGSRAPNVARRAATQVASALSSTALVPVAEVSRVTADSIARVQSWLAMDTMTFKGDVSNSTGGDLRDGLRHMAAQEARLRYEVGPEFGFDLSKIQGHYDHRQALRALYPVLRMGEFTVLTAKHRFGEHGHVLAFARSLPGHVAVIATNFNAFASTFAVNTTPLVSAFRASTTASASASVAQLMAASSAVGSLLHAHVSDGVNLVSSTDVSMNLAGGVWEVRDVFSSETLHGAATLHFDESHGPLIGIMTSEEAAYAPMLATLQPHKSYAWMYVETQAAAASVRSAESDAAAMRWLFASSLLRLQSVLRLKEAGLTSAIITRQEIETAGGLDAVLAARKTGSVKEPWISPGESLNDNEIVQNVRHNLVFSLARHVVDRCYRARVAGKPPRAVLEETAGLLDAALRVLVTHLHLRADAPAVPPAGVPPPRLTASPLPSLHGAMNRSGTGVIKAEQANAAESLDSWFCIDGETAAILVRSSLFLAVKDVVAQHSGATSISADVSDTDAQLSSTIIKALRWVAAGRTTSGAALRSDGVLSSVASESQELLLRERSIVALARRVLWTNTVSPIVFVTPELGKWSTVGGLGVMVDELSVGLAELGADVICISPYYNLDRKGNRDYLRRDGITYSGRNVTVWVGDERIDMGVHEGRVNHVRVLFLHNESVFPRPYPALDAAAQVRVLAAFGQGCLELLCQWNINPAVVVSNDWFTSLVPAYARHSHLVSAFNRTDFLHIAHNLDPDYEGRLWPDRAQGSLQYLHKLPSNLVVDPNWHDHVFNPTRAALLCIDTWATVSRSYRADLLSSSPLRNLLRLTPQPFAHPNGIPVKARLARLARLAAPTHEAAKEVLQVKYFKFRQGDPTIPLFAFVGRITLQKGVHLILQAVEEMLRATHDRVMFLVGGMASSSDTYGRGCGEIMRRLARDHPDRFWADPDLFFTDGDLVNLGADFCMMPSMFEPGGIVQQEFFVAGTPVIAFKTGGLKDTVVEFNPAVDYLVGNGFHFEAHTVHDFMMACHRANAVFRDADMYAQLRRNAKASVMDLAVVSLAWYREFFRMRRALPPGPDAASAILSQSVVVSLPLASASGATVSPASTVVVRSSASGWKVDTPARFVSDPDRFEAVLQVDPGQYQYGFWVDGKVWLVSTSSPVVSDGCGNTNNLLEVHSSEDLDDGLLE